MEYMTLSVKGPIELEVELNELAEAGWRLHSWQGFYYGDLGFEIIAVMQRLAPLNKEEMEKTPQ